MLTIDMCKIRYAALPTKSMDTIYGQELIRALERYSDLLPPYLIHDDNGMTYVYFAVEPFESVLRLMCRSMNVFGNYYLLYAEDLA